MTYAFNGKKYTYRRGICAKCGKERYLRTKTLCGKCLYEATKGENRRNYIKYGLSKERMKNKTLSALREEGNKAKFHEVLQTLSPKNAKAFMLDGSLLKKRLKELKTHG